MQKKETMTRLYSYVLRYDDGAATNHQEKSGTP